MIGGSGNAILQESGKNGERHVNSQLGIILRIDAFPKIKIKNSSIPLV